jgi:hypothetical protein
MVDDITIVIAFLDVGGSGNSSTNGISNLGVVPAVVT